MLFKICLVYGFFGLLAGIVGALSFFRSSDPKSKTVSSLLTLLFSGGMALPPIFKFDEEQFSTILICFSGCFFVGILIVLLLIIFSIKRIKDMEGNQQSFIPTVFDLLVGADKWQDRLYSKKANEFDNQNQKEIDYKLKRNELLQSMLDERDHSAPELLLPINVYVPVTKSFIELLPIYLERIIQFRIDLDLHTRDFVKDLTEDVSNGNREEVLIKLHAFFSGMGLYMAITLFGASGGIDEIRTHFRIFSNNAYTTFLVFNGNSLVTDSLTDIPCDSGNLINKSFREKRALIASLNGQDVYDTHSSIWNDFMTYAFQTASFDEHPFLSFGISIQSIAQYRDLIFLVNYCNIEKWIEKSVSQIDEICPLSNYLACSETGEFYYE